MLEPAIPCEVAMPHAWHAPQRAVVYHEKQLLSGMQRLLPYLELALPKHWDMRSAAKFELRVAAGATAPFTGMFAASSVGVMRCVVPMLPPCVTCRNDRGTGCDVLVPHIQTATRVHDDCWLVSALSCGLWCAVAACMHALQQPSARFIHSSASSRCKAWAHPTTHASRRFSLGRMAHPPFTPAAALKLLVDGQKVRCNR